MTTSAAGVAFPVKAAIEAKLTEALEPSFLEVINESHMHKV
jgi:stress-induced morphogen